ncbi:STM4504/CBY_0614 family protein [Rhizobium sp.]|uniref:STM4504/CBY_0614 family protein n=1 Tax=Rhizobium sp. TaxID=391 RepID=UPI000DB925D8
MAVFDIFSKRQKRLRGEVPDVYQYDEISGKLRTQVIHIINDAIGTEAECQRSSEVHEAYDTVVGILRREYGIFSLDARSFTKTYSMHAEFVDFISRAHETEECLDAIELALKLIDTIVRDNFYYRNGRGGETVADDAIEEMNRRFKEDGLGYEFVDGELIRIDSQLLHAEAVKPALLLLNTEDYKGPHEEFLSAYEHYRLGNNKEALTDGLKAFESTMKAICDKRRWAYDPTKDTAKKLIDILFDNGLIPQFWQTQFASLRSLLESSVPTGRNKLSGHGQGATPQTVPDHLTAYMLHMTASTLVFLTTAEKEFP